MTNLPLHFNRYPNTLGQSVAKISLQLHVLQKYIKQLLLSQRMKKLNKQMNN